MIERIQRSYTAKIPGIQGSYLERLRILDLEPLQLRRLYIDLTEVFKIIHGISFLNFSDFFIPGNNQTRGHKLKLLKQKAQCDERKYFFSNRVINNWNRLTEKIIDTGSISTFKKLLKENDFLARSVIDNYMQFYN